MAKSETVTAFVKLHISSSQSILSNKNFIRIGHSWIKLFEIILRAEIIGVQHTVVKLDNICNPMIKINLLTLSDML